MCRKRYRVLLIMLVFLLTLAGQAYPPNSLLTFAGEGEGETLTVRGDGVSQEITFTRQQLEQMTEAVVQYEYSSANNFPTEKTFYRKGVLLEALLKQAGIKDSAKQLKFISSDGYTKTFTREELLTEARFCFKQDGSKAEVPVILSFYDSAKGFDSLSPDELCLTMGQRVRGEQNNPWFVKYLKTIEVTNDEPGQWSPVSFTKSMGPDGVTVKLNHTDIDSVKIYYTLDGTNPAIGSRVYNVSATYYQPALNKPVLLTEDGEIRAMAAGPGRENSPVSSTTVTFGGGSFTDLSDYSWAKLAIESLAGQKIINGMGDGRFAPEQNLTRAQFATMMVLAMGETPSAIPATGAPQKLTFNDVKAADWHFGYVEKAAEKGWIKGYTDGSFQPQRTLSREEMITIVIQALGKADLNKEETDKILNSFAKESRISDWAKPYTAKAEQMGLLEHGHLVSDSGGKLIFDAQRRASRAEAAVTVYRMLNVK